MNQTHTDRTAEAVRVEVARRQIKRRELATLLNLSPATISKRLSGTHGFRVHELVAVAAHLGVPVTTFLPDEETAA